MPLLRDAKRVYTIVRGGLRARATRRAWAEFDAARGPLPEDTFEAVVYFADSRVNMYQIRQWMDPMARLAETHPVAIITRNSRTARLITDECDLPVVNFSKIADVERWVARQKVATVFYVNQNTRNFQMMRLREPAHVHLSHGESDKDSMSSNQLKAYDYAFIAGDAARARLSARLIGYDVDARTIEIGRPQVDVHHAPPVELPADGRTVVLYAPTWEGDRPAMTYSSLVSHAGAMIPALLASGEHRIVYRPHPRTGVADQAYRAAHEAIVAALEAANEEDPAAGHVVDTASPFGWHLDAADACIADISAVTFDWLATGKPLVLTAPSSPEADVDMTGIAGSLPLIAASEAAGVLAVLAEADSEHGRSVRGALAARYYGDVTPGASMRRWLEACERVLAERAPHVALRRAELDEAERRAAEREALEGSAPEPQA